MGYQMIDGDLIELAKNREFDVIAHGCNCFNSMSGGLAPQMAAAFGCDKFFLESKQFEGIKEKLGKIDWQYNTKYKLFVVNAYTQYKPGPDFRYKALNQCLKSMSQIFDGKRIGLPKIGSGIGGGDWGVIEGMIKKTLSNCEVTVVNFNKPIIPKIDGKIR
jgi:O-acetyl-ADP-ribose deacetylase (regulator of RNase III)